MKTKLIRIFALLLVGLSILASTASLAHSGRTDSSGGHKDNKNASGLGSYHYHHGTSAHLHPDGACPYESSAEAAPKPTKAPSANTQRILDAQQKLNDLGYDCDEPNGKVGKATKAALKQFQKDNNLKSTGTLNDATYKLLMDK